MKDWMRRKIWRKQALIYFTDDAFILAGYQLQAVHCIPEHVANGQELDFYLDTGYDIYLLRLINRTDDTISICPASNTCPIYIICRVSYNKQNILTVLENLLAQLYLAGLPKLKNPKQEIIISLK